MSKNKFDPNAEENLPYSWLGNAIFETHGRLAEVMKSQESQTTGFIEKKTLTVIYEALAEVFLNSSFCGSKTGKQCKRISVKEAREILKKHGVVYSREATIPILKEAWETIKVVIDDRSYLVYMIRSLGLIR